MATAIDFSKYELNGKFELIDINHTDLKKLIKKFIAICAAVTGSGFVPIL